MRGSSSSSASGSHRLLGALLESAGILGDSFDLQPIVFLGLVAALVLIPPGVAASVVYGAFLERRDLETWLRLVPISYPATFMLGLSVLQMVLFTPILLFQRWHPEAQARAGPAGHATGNR